MTKQEAYQYFREFILPSVESAYGPKDRVAKAEEWNNFTDALCKEGQITLKQYESWDNPF